MESAQDAVTDAMDVVVAFAMTYGLSVIGAIIILVVGWMAAGWISAATKKWLERLNVETTLRLFFANAVRYLVLGFVIIAVLSQFGVQTASLIAVFGAIGLAIGLALQGTLGNIASGVMILLFRPFKVDDFVDIAGTAGTVKAVGLFSTELATPDNVQIIVPNGAVWGSVVRNFSYHATRRVDYVFGIAYEDNIGAAMQAIHEEIKADDRVLPEPEPMVVVSNLGDSSVDLTVRIWCNAGDYWGLKFDLTRAVKERFDRDGISIPYPQRVVHQGAAAD
jgi:small conductance mechanosensitive channel